MPRSKNSNTARDSRPKRHQLDQIEAFLEVVDAGSVSAAADRLDLAKSVVSKRISDLERILGVELLRRSTRGVVPTERGKAFHARSRAALHDLERAADDAALRDGRLCGSLRIAAPMSFGTLVLGPILFPFFREHPDLVVDLDLDDRVIDAAGLGYDVVVRIGRLADSSLVAKKLAVSRRVVCCSPVYARRAGLPRDLEQLERHPAIGYSYRQSSRIWQFEPERAGGKPRSVSMSHRIACNNGEAIRDAAIAGLGLALLPRFIVAAALRSGALIDALPETAPVVDEVHALYPRMRQPSPKVRRLVDHLRSALASSSAGEWQEGPASVDENAPAGRASAGSGKRP